MIFSERVCKTHLLIKNRLEDMQEVAIIATEKKVFNYYEV